MSDFRLKPGEKYHVEIKDRFARLEIYGPGDARRWLVTVDMPNGKIGDHTGAALVVVAGSLMQQQMVNDEKRTSLEAIEHQMKMALHKIGMGPPPPGAGGPDLPPGTTKVCPKCHCAMKLTDETCPTCEMLGDGDGKDQKTGQAQADEG